MVHQIPDLPDDVVGFTATGKVTARDYEAEIIPAVEAMFSRHGKGRFLYHLSDEFTGFEAGAAWDDASLGFKHITAWERMAVVTDVQWIRAALKAFGLLLPGRVRVFDGDELAEATRWVSE